MRIDVKTQIGQAQFTFMVDEKDPMDALHFSAVLGNPRRYCDACKNTDAESFRLDSNKDKEGNTYVNVVCCSCGAKSKLGQYKAGGIFWHKFEKYEPNKQHSDSQKQEKKVTWDD